MLGLLISVRLKADQMMQMNRKGRYRLTGRPVPIPVCQDEKESGRNHPRSDGRVPKIRGRDDVGLEYPISCPKGLTDGSCSGRVTFNETRKSSDHTFHRGPELNTEETSETGGDPPSLDLSSAK